MNKKKILSLALVLLLICTISFGTLAWFNAADEVTNTFHVATSEDPKDPDDIFSVDVWEYTDNDTTVKKQGAQFKNILPGAKLHKEVHIENTGAYSQWIRVHVTLTEANFFQEALGPSYDLSKIFLGHEEEKWTRDPETRSDSHQGSLTYTYYLNAPLSAGQNVYLFKEVVIPTELTQEHMAKMGGNFALTVKAEAIQADNLIDSGNNVTNAKEAFDFVKWEIGKAYGE